MALRSIDLMIEDWVQVIDACTGKSTPCKITSIWENEYVALDGDIDAADLPTNLLEPIPLTSEILEKNGFKPDVPGDAYKYSYQIEGVSIVECYINAAGIGRHRGVFSFGDTRLRITLMFVHQLQHALRLCGINKKIKL